MSHSSITYHFVQELPTEQLIELYELEGWWQERPRSRANLPAMIKGSFCFLVAKVEDHLVGMGRVISDGVSDGYIQDIVVRPEYRKQGIGLKLVQKLRDHCIEKELEWIGLIAEPGTRSFYERAGFVELEGDTPMILAL